MPLPQSRAPKAPAFQYRKPVRNALVWWLRCFGIIALLAILLRLPHEGGATLAHIDLRWLGFCVLLTIGQLLLEALAWQWLLSRQRIRHPYPKTLVAYLASQYLGLVTPGHVGEFLAAGYVSTETGITMGYALSSVVMKKALTWVTVVSFGIWGLQLLPQVPVLKSVQRAVVVSFLVLVVLSAGISLWVVSLRRLVRKWGKLSPWQVDPTECWAGISTLFSPRLIFPLGITAFAFSLLFLEYDAILHALGITTISPGLIGRVVAFSRIVGRIVPFSMVGFGSKDAAIIELLHQYGIDRVVGLTVTLLFLLCSYLVTLLLSGLCWWIKLLVIRFHSGRS